LPAEEGASVAAPGRTARDDAAVVATARTVLEAFDVYYVESRGIPARAKGTFEARDPAGSLHLSRRRLSIYSDSIRRLAGRLKGDLAGLGEDEGLWRAVEARYLDLVGGRYEADLAVAYIHSVRRVIYQDEWRSVEYSFGAAASRGPATVYRELPLDAPLTAETVVELLRIPDFTAPFQDLAGDAAAVAERVNRDLGLDAPGARIPRSIQMMDAGFYRNRGAYLIGRIVRGDSGLTPLVLSLDHHTRGIFVDAVLTSEADTHNLFSSTLANFHVTNPHYHELAEFLHSIMPHRPLGLHYSTIGFNHVGKVAVMNELRGELEATGEVLDRAVGFRGTVAIGFSAPSSDYVLKIIRDRPTEQYKWGKFGGIESVLRKYGQVHEINRTGSMLDNIIYYNISLDRRWFAPELLAEFAAQAGQTVSRQGEVLVFKHLIVQLKMIPLPVFLETASPEAAECAVVNLGHCIRNNAAANIFNKDLDARNYGVSRYLKVFLYDYDAIEPLAAVKIRTNQDRVEGEEDIPDWFFEDGIIFLPEEIEAGLCICNTALSRCFRREHADLLTADYWNGVQRALLQGRVPRIRVYPDAARLRSRSVDVSRV
jgi:isocitrate dehydrogenase kinase/phosphatase